MTSYGLCAAIQDLLLLNYKTQHFICFHCSSFTLDKSNNVTEVNVYSET